jgi:sugar porter (SP) family MFS transporter
MKKYRYSLWISLVASLGALLFGYCSSVISGAILFILRQIPMTTFEEEILVSILLIGAVLGAVIGGIISDKTGRRHALFITAVLFLIGTTFLYIATGFFELLIGRIITGIAIGIASLVVPLYIAEVSPINLRGRFVSFNQLAISLGVLLAYSINYSLASDGEWQVMFGFAFIPAALLFLGTFFIPETPAFLATQGEMGKAKLILSRIHRSKQNEEVFIETKKSSLKDLVNWKHLLDVSLKNALIVGILLSCFQQITGINTIIYYAPQIFNYSGFTSASSATLATVGIGMMNVLATFIGLWLVDIVGRRRLLIVGVTGMIISLIILSFSFWISSKPIPAVTILCLMGYVSFFAIGLGVVTWIFLSEIFPMGIRGRAMGIATFANWISNFVVSLTFLTLLEVLGMSATFFLYALISSLSLYFIWKKIPETKGESFEQIQAFWRK